MCGFKAKSILYDADVAHPSVAHFLKDYYKGRVTIGDLKEWRYQVAECPLCGFIWQTYVLGDTLAHKLYSEWISPSESMDKKKAAGMALRRGYAEEAVAISFLIKKPAEQIIVLDYGMGWGQWCFMMWAFGYKIFGYEIASERVSSAQGAGISVLDDDAFKTMHFDFVNCEQVLEHVSSPLETFKKLAQSLKCGGYLRVAVPNGAGIRRAMQDPFWIPGKNAIHPLEHVNCFTRKTLVNLGIAAGLRPLSRFGLLRVFFSSPRLCVRHILGGTSLYFLKI